jgi:hypothetical protein
MKNATRSVPNATRMSFPFESTSITVSPIVLPGAFDGSI